MLLERTIETSERLEINDGRYIVKIAESPIEVESALRLRYEVFTVEMGGRETSADPSRVEFDEFDFRCRHLLVIDRATSRTVGTYRLNSIETAGRTEGFYSYNEFTIEDLPPEILQQGVEIGRACIAADHRNTKVLFLLWKGLAAYLQTTRKRFFFGCCSIFTPDATVGERAFSQLAEAGQFHKTLRVEPRKNALYAAPSDGASVELPNLFNMYLRLGARVCGPPMMDHAFGSIDFFVICDTTEITEKYRRMFFA